MNRQSCDAAQQDLKVQPMQHQKYVFFPRLRKNRKLELRWGIKYYEAVKSAVFNVQPTPYTPAEPPQSMKGDIDKTGYICKQCRDCFRFLSSIEEHTSRRSWVLGYWCQHCFVTTCSHKVQGKSNCSNCIDIETAKHDYLLSKGMKKNFKKGVTRVFYNQCQFFAHLRIHGINVVDLSDVMLMPLPYGIHQKYNAQLDKIWKAVMEVMFIRRIHIMDWTRDNKISWDQILLNSDLKKCEHIFDIVSRYSEDCIGVIDKSESSRQDNPIQFEDSRRKAKSIGSHVNSTQPRFTSGDGRRNTVHVVSTKTRNDEIVDETFTRNDIAFVDCGPTPINSISESSGTSSPDRSVEFSEKESSTSEKEGSGIANDVRNNPLRPLSQQYDEHRNKSGDVAQKSNEDRVVSSSLPSLSRAGPRVLTIRSPRTLSLSTIMKHLPNDGVNCKKLVVVADDSKAGNGVPEANTPFRMDPDSLEGTLDSNVSKLPVLELMSVKSSASVVTNAPRNDVNPTPSTKLKMQPPPNLLLNHRDKPESAPNAVAQTFSEQMSLHGKIVFQNGRKYIIRHVPKAKYQSIVQNSLAKKQMQGPPPLSVPISVSKRHLLPKPTSVPVTISVSATKPFVIKQQPQLNKILPKPTTPAVFPLAPPNKTMLPTRISKYHKSVMDRSRESMEKNLHKTSRKELAKYIVNLKEINEAFAKAIDFDGDDIISSNMKVIQRFEKFATSAPKTKEGEPDVEAESTFEKSARDWESSVKNCEKRNCETCGKYVKPAGYIVGMSGPATDESLFCQCYNNVCYLCNTNQGSLVQLKAHINWHKGKKPFMCPDCSLIFRTAKELEVHIWTTCFHPMSRHIFGCGVCEIEGILDMEAVTKHFLLLHTRRKTICTECKMEYSQGQPSQADYDRHYAHHRGVARIPESKQLLLCNLKQCVVRPEQFRAHLSDHIGVLKWVYYKCPFCAMIAQGTGRNKMTIRQHLIDYHLDRLHEVVSAESLPEILKGIQNPPPSSATAPQTASAIIDAISQVSNANTSGPMIINARTITPESFEHGADASHELHDNSTLPRILDVRSEANDEFETSDSAQNAFGMQIIAVESIAENRCESPEPKSEVSDEVSQESTSDELTSFTEYNGGILQIFSSPVKDDVDDDSSNSNEDMMENYVYSPPKFKGKSSSLLEANDESQEWDISEKYDSVLLTPTETKKTTRRPWRIALNSPTSMDTTPVAYNCHVCGELINTSWSVIKNHFSTRHASDYELSVVSPQIPQISPGYIEGGYREDCGVRKRKTEGQISPGSKRRRRWGPKKHFERPGSPSFGLCVRPEPVQEVEGSFRCKKCDELFDEISMMREHIATKHRIKGQYLICLECGENFVVVPSLQMHLKALHGIQDPITYLTKNTAYAPDTPEDTDEEERTTEANQCYVCMAVFEDKAAVDKHIRVHGMAFLKRKRFEAQKAQKCSAKQGESPDNNNTAVSSGNKSKIAEEAAKVSLNTVETSESNSKAQIFDDSTKNIQKPLKFWVKKFDFPVSSDATASFDDKSRNDQDCMPVTENKEVGPLEITGAL